MDLKKVERQAYMTVWEDGLIDLNAGIALLGIGLAWVFEQPVFGAIMPALLVPIWTGLRRRIAFPRVGMVVLSPQRRTAERRKLGVLVVGGVLTLALAVVVYFVARRDPSAMREAVGDWIPALPSLLLGFGAALVGTMFGIQRFFVYCAVLLGAGVAGTLLDLEPGWHLLTAGVVVTTIGCVLLIRFVRRYPLPKDEG